jgi:hypothetical protein
VKAHAQSAIVRVTDPGRHARQIVRFDQLMKLRQQLAQTPKIRPPEELFRGEQSDLIRFD